MFLWAVCFPLIVVGLDLAPHLSFATLRALLAGGTLVTLGILTGRAWPAGRSTWLLLGVVGIGATSLGFLGMFHAAEFVAPGTATVIANTQPLLAAALAGVVLKERLGLAGATGLGLGFLGIVVIAGFGTPSGGANYRVGIAYIVLAAIGITVSNVVLKRLAGTVDPIMAAGTQMLLGAIPLAVLSLTTESPTSITWSSTFVFSLLALALPGTALVYWLWLTVLETSTLNRANAFSFLVPIFGLALGIAFYGERLTLPAAVGVAITVAGVVVVNRRRPTSTTEEPERAGRSSTS
jgi:drug/metabolite transporter (DMT)-like permease